MMMESLFAVVDNFFCCQVWLSIAIATVWFDWIRSWSCLCRFWIRDKAWAATAFDLLGDLGKTNNWKQVLRHFNCFDSRRSEFQSNTGWYSDGSLLVIFSLDGAEPACWWLQEWCIHEIIFAGNTRYHVAVLINGAFRGSGASTSCKCAPDVGLPYGFWIKDTFIHLIYSHTHTYYRKRGRLMNKRI